MIPLCSIMSTKVTEKWVKNQVTKQLKELGAYYFFIDENNLDEVTRLLKP